MDTKYKCKSCGRLEGEHLANKGNCPIISRYRRSFPSYHNELYYQPDYTKPVPKPKFTI